MTTKESNKENKKTEEKKEVESTKQLPKKRRPSEYLEEIISDIQYANNDLDDLYNSSNSDYEDQNEKEKEEEDSSADNFFRNFNLRNTKKENNVQRLFTAWLSK